MISTGISGTASATGSAVYSGFSSSPSESSAILGATLNAQHRAAADGFSTSQCLKVGQVEEHNFDRYYVEVDLGCGPAYAVVVPNLIGTSRFDADGTLQAAGLSLGGQTAVQTCDDSPNIVTNPASTFASTANRRSRSRSLTSGTSTRTTRPTTLAARVPMSTSARLMCAGGRAAARVGVYPSQPGKVAKVANSCRIPPRTAFLYERRNRIPPNQLRTMRDFSQEHWPLLDTPMFGPL